MPKNPQALSEVERKLKMLEYMESASSSNNLQSLKIMQLIERVNAGADSKTRKELERLLRRQQEWDSLVAKIGGSTSEDSDDLSDQAF